MNEQNRVYLLWEDQYWGPYEPYDHWFRGVFATQASAEAAAVQLMTEQVSDIPPREVDEQGVVRWVWVHPDDRQRDLDDAHPRSWWITEEVVR